MWMLDTNICSYILKCRPAPVKARFDLVDPREICISCIVLAELHYGAARHPQGQRIREDIDDFMARLSVFSWDEKAAEAYGSLRAILEKQGRTSGNMDMMIAAHALSQSAVLVTNNIRHFEHIPNLIVENWTAPVIGGSGVLHEDKPRWPGTAS
ncbi:type II toxin-antitoxin system tRNA(fMet)-specific endonuclease VapC [Desulfonatronum parangueonense]